MDQSRLDAEIREYERRDEARARMAHELHEGEKVERSITIMRSVGDVFAYWRDFENLPNFMTHLKSIEVLSPVRSHWSWKAIAGMTLEWDAEIIAEIHNQMISWQTLPDSSVNHAGSVWFRPAPQDGATEVHVQFLYHVPGGKFTRLIAELFGTEPGKTLSEDLRRLKSLMETGEIPTTRGQPHGGSEPVH